MNCIDCLKNLDGLLDWEPVLVPEEWSYETGTHGAICLECIEDVYQCREDVTGSTLEEGASLTLTV